MTTEDLKYPIGKFKMPSQITNADKKAYISSIANFPKHLQKEIATLKDTQIDTPYRLEGWTIRQLVNHCADSHMNALIRYKLALTEDTPTIKPYKEAKWAELADSIHIPITPALQMLEGIHERWEYLLKSLNDKDFKRTYLHPEHNKVFTLDETTALYAWHCNHHLAHITSLKKTNGWA